MQPSRYSASRSQLDLRDPLALLLILCTLTQISFDLRNLVSKDESIS
jgi:hypothetical protein